MGVNFIIVNNRAIFEPYAFDQNDKEPSIKVYSLAMGFFLSLFGAAKAIHLRDKIVYLNAKEASTWLKTFEVLTPPTFSGKWLENALAQVICLKKLSQEQIKKPKDSEIWYEIAQIYDSLGNRSKAIDHISKAIELNNERFFFKWKRAEFYESSNMMKEAIEDYKQISKLNPEDWLFSFKIASLSTKIENFYEAIHICNDLLKTYLPDEISVLFLIIRGNTYNKTNQKDLALKDYTKALKAYAIYAKTHKTEKLILDVRYKRWREKIDKAMHNLQKWHIYIENKELFEEAEKKCDVLSFTADDVRISLNSTKADGVKIHNRLIGYLRSLFELDINVITSKGLVYIDYQEVRRWLINHGYKVSNIKAFDQQTVQEVLEIIKLNKKIEQKPQTAKFYFWRACYHINQFNIEQALADITKALDLDSNNLRYLEERIDLLRMKNTPEALQAAIQDCEKIHHAKPSYWFALGVSSHEVKDELKNLLKKLTEANSI